MHPMIRALEDSEDSAYVLSSDLRILNTNRGYRSFAARNGGSAILERWSTGAHIDDALPPPLREFYRDAYASALATGERWEHEYECSSPTHYRKLRMRVYPIDGDRLVVVNSLVVEMPHAGHDHPPDDAYLVGGVITMCAHCRRTLNRRTLAWDWVPNHVRAQPAKTSHGLCPPCLEFYYPEPESAAAL